MKQKLEFRNINIRLIVWLIGLSVIGVFAIGSAKESLQMRQLAGVIVGVFLMVFLMFFDYKLVLKLYWVIYVVNVALLVLVNQIGDSSNNSQRWIELAGIRFQPSEAAKILLILFFAQFIMKHKEDLNTIWVLGIALITFLIDFILIYKQPDLSTSIMIVIIFCTVMYVGGVSRKLIYVLIAVTIPIVVVSLFLVLQPDQDIIEGYQQKRILAWLQPDKYALSEAFQQQNSITAIGSGQLFGKGLNNNEVGSVKNGKYISEPQTDFIFAIIGEEMGFAGGATVILLEMLIAWECFLIGTKARDLAGSIICYGMGSLVCFQSFINISVTTGLLPNTGLPLPFVSYGLTSLITLYGGMGFVLSVGLHRKTAKPAGTISFTELLQEDIM